MPLRGLEIGIWCIVFGDYEIRVSSYEFRVAGCGWEMTDIDTVFVAFVLRTIILATRAFLMPNIILKCIEFEDLLPKSWHKKQSRCIICKKIEKLAADKCRHLVRPTQRNRLRV